MSCFITVLNARMPHFTEGPGVENKFSGINDWMVTESGASKIDGLLVSDNKSPANLQKKVKQQTVD